MNYSAVDWSAFRRSFGSFHPATAIPSLVMVETWRWTPLVMLILLGGLAAIPTKPYESAQIDGASQWQDVPLHHPADALPRIPSGRCHHPFHPMR